MIPTMRWGLPSLGLLLSITGLAACGGDAEGRPSGTTLPIPTTSSSSGSSGSSGGETVGESGDGDGDPSSSGPLLDVAPGDGDPDPDTGGECAAVSEQAQNQYAPVDIIFAIDTSGSMSEEKNFVQQNMNMFSQQIFLANIDHHVVMIAESSPDGPCVNVPLGSGSCPADTNLPNYLHVVQTVSSSNALEVILNTHNLWLSSIRDNSIKHVVVVSDDNSAMDANTFDGLFTDLDLSYQNYFFHAIVAFDDPDPLECLGGQANCCAGFIPISADIGQVYLDLAALTGGIAGDLCDQDFGPVFNQIAQSVQQTVPLACEWEIPDPPRGQNFDPTKVNVELELDGQDESVYYVDSEADCNGGDGWFYLPDAQNPETIRICPETCTRVQAATEASVDILFGCATIPVG